MGRAGLYIDTHILNQLSIDCQSQTTKQKSLYMQHMCAYIQNSTGGGETELQRQIQRMAKEQEEYTNKIKIPSKDRQEYAEGAVICLGGNKKQHILTQLKQRE